MRRCSSGPTMSRRAGRSCSRSSTPGPIRRPRTSRTTRPARRGRRRRTSCCSATAADVDGTLVTEQKILTDRAQAAVHSLHEAGIRFAITSGRPPKGMEMLFDPLKLETPIAGFNGGLFVNRDLSIIEQKTLPPDVASRAFELIRQHGLDAWVYSGNDWLITKKDAPHVAREAWTVKFEAKVVSDFSDALKQAAKIVGVSDDHDKVKACEADAQKAFGDRATAARSQPYYLD